MERFQDFRAVEGILGSYPVLKYSGGSLNYSQNKIQSIDRDELLLLVNGVSICGTDSNMFNKVRDNDMPEMKDITAGHEVFGTVVGVGKNVQKARIGDILCPDSHYSCSIHSHFNDCVNSGNSCDGIVGGIKYSNLSDTHRDGYWAQCVKVHQSSFTKPIPPNLLKNIPTASILESMGNIFEIFISAKQNNLLHKGLLQ